MKKIVPKAQILNIHPKRRFWKSGLFIGLIASALFIIISSFHLTGPGLYYDELHQAAGSFVYQGNYEYEHMPKYMFVTAEIMGIPVLNMTYSGALKTCIYGLYLRYFNSNFSVLSWRLLGIIFVIAGIFFSSIIIARILPPVWLFLFLFLFLTDITVVMATRHDWGPVALGLLIRLVFIATWIYGETKEFTSLGNSFFLGSLIGIAAYEKLSSIVLIIPLILIFIFSLKRRSFRHYLACSIGCLIGGLPLIIGNLITYFKNGYFISIAGAARSYQAAFPDFLTYITTYISLGAGTLVKKYILGTHSTINNHVEGVLVGTILLLIIILDVCYWKTHLYFRLSGILILCYISVGIALYFFPNSTWVHHWIIGTPFQYAAISFTLIGFFSRNNTVNFHVKFFRIILCFLLVLLVIPRLFGIVSLERSFQRGETSVRWDPSLSKIGYFANNRSNEAIFLAPDWGVATQIFCLSNGRPDLVYELFWEYKGIDEIISIIKRSGKKIVYLVNKKPNSDVFPDNTTKILRDINRLTCLKEVPVEDDLTDLRAVELRKFYYIVK